MKQFFTTSSLKQTAKQKKKKLERIGERESYFIAIYAN